MTKFYKWTRSTKEKNIIGILPKVITWNVVKALDNTAAICRQR